MLAAQIRGRDPGLVFLQNPDDLLIREAAEFHVLVLSLGQNELQTGLSQRGNVNSYIGMITGILQFEYLTAKQLSHEIEFPSLLMLSSRRE